MTALPDGTSTTHWVFGYGSLIWRPGFAYLDARSALLRGAHRQLCIYSHHYRGTPDRPGLVFGLARGGSCRGMAFEVADNEWESVHAYLVEREQVTGVYREVQRPVLLDTGRLVSALAFVVDESHSQYAGRMDTMAQARLIAAASGKVGPNTEYVLNTVNRLAEMGIEDRRLAALARLLLPG